MNLFVDGMFFGATGVGRVCEGLLGELAGQEWVEGIDTVVPAAREKEFRLAFPGTRIRPVFVGYGPMSGADLLLKGRLLGSCAARVKLFFFPGHNVPLSVPGKYVMTVHDLTVFSPLFRLSALRRSGFRLLMSRALRGAERIVTVSETTKSDLLRKFPVRPEKVVVIHNWVGERFLGGPPGDSPAIPAGGEYILFLGLRIAHKNIDGIVRAFCLLADEFPRLRLVVAGARYRAPDMIDEWRGRDDRLKERIVEVLDPADGEIGRLLAGAKAFVFPSFAEGFGLPPLEAMAAGAPVICSDIPVFREVYGDGPLYVDPRRPESIADAIRSVLVSPALAEGMRERGRITASRYTRRRAMRSYLDLIRSVASDPG